jgi:hypothetical protein
MRFRPSCTNLLMLSAAALAAGFLPVLPAAAASSASSGGIGQLRGVYCTSPRNCWAVGYLFVHSADVNQVLHWNGNAWSREPVPSPGGTKVDDFSELFAIRCTSLDSCWAVGEYLHGALLNEVLHWNGKKWLAAAEVPAPGGKASGDSSELTDVACTSATSCWAGGQYGHSSSGGDVILNQALRWNGKQWSVSHPPDPAGTGVNDENVIDAIRCASPGDCWAVGTYGSEAAGGVLRNEVLHWTGTKWRTVAVPDPGGTGTADFSSLQSVSCTAAASCKAAGSYGSNLGGDTRLNQVLRWNGKKWSVSHVPDPDGTSTGAAQNLTSISCLTGTSCWAVGHSGTQVESTGTRDEAFRWNGKNWTLVSTPDPGGMAMDDVSQLFGIRCATSADCWAVGDQVDGGGAFHDLILHWNGAKWSAS